MTKDFKNKKVVIMGLGVYERGSGVSSAAFFARAGARVLVTDMKPREHFAGQIKKLAKYKNIQFIFGKHDEKDFLEAYLIIKNPAVPKHSPILELARKHKIPIHNDWSIFLSLKNNFLVGVTGTRGKSTTATLIYEILKQKYPAVLCGNVGISPLAVINKLKKDDVVVAELPSWGLQQFDAVKKSPNIAIVTNLLRDHLNTYKNIGEYYADKEKIFRYQTANDYLIANADDKELKKRIKRVKSKVFWFSKKPFSGDGAYVKDGKILFSRRGEINLACSVSDIKLIGEHNLYNVLAAICAVMVMNVGIKQIRAAVKNFKGVANRLELIKEINGVKYYNDTTATNPDATIAALRALNSRNIILLAGGADKKLDFKELAKTIPKFVKTLILFKGNASDKIFKNIRKSDFLILGVFENVPSMKEAMQIAQANAKSGDIILLSPAAASFGIFKNEFDRGEQFCYIVGNK